MNFQDIFNELKDTIAALAKVSFKKWASEAEQDGRKLLEDMKDKLQRWTELLAQGQITPKDFEMLVLNQRDLTEMAALRQAGLSLIRAEQFRDSVVNVVIDSITHLVGV